MTNRTATILFVLGILFISFNLRPAITAVGPLVPLIREDTGMSNSLAGSLTTIPLLSFAAFSLIAPKLGLRFGNNLAVFAALATLVTGIFLRTTGLITAILVGTALIGIGIAVCNVLLPGIIKFNFPQKVGIMTSIYTAGMGLFASIGSGLSIPLAETAGLGWEMTLAIWGLLGGLALVFWAPQLKGSVSARTSSAVAASVDHNHMPIWKSSLAWYVTLFMGLQSFVFYNMIAWLPDVLQSLGVSLAFAGWTLFLLQLIGIPFSFAVPLLATRLRNQQPIVVGICSLYVISMSGLLFLPNLPVIIISALCLGIGQGAAISLALTLLGLRAKEPQEAARLSGMAQSVGYLLAASGPVLMGVMYDTFSTWQPFLYTILVVSFLVLAFGLKAGQNRYIFES
ncbi:CynX/NimT family MFS transporter [Salsuginibacillus kocurii]|uniref:CynX/NimT family MFS transporter n=1 Tax=Salsuginibacillus kocurii TaxID=427078 RepID=UPI0003794547|nr:MFS transporter [Salsuginibacillus kocurii]